MPGGRPTKYDPDVMLPIIEEGGSNGEGMAELIVNLGISRDTFYNWSEKHSEFSDAIKEYRSRSQAWWESKGRLHTFDKGEGFNATSYIFNMKNRFADDWKDKIEQENSGTVTVVNLSEDFDDF